MKWVQKTSLLIIVLCMATGVGCGDPYEKGLEAKNAGRYKEALTRFQQVRKLEQDYQSARREIKKLYFLIGKEAYGRGDWSEATEYLEKVNSDDKVHYAEARNLLGAIVYHRGKEAYERNDWKEADSLLQTVPKSCRAYGDAQALLMDLQAKL